MKRIKIFLKILLILSVISSLFHLYISFFQNEVCFWNSGVIFGIADFLNPYLLAAFLLVFLSFAIYVLLKQYPKYWEVMFVLGISSLANILDRFAHGAVCDYIGIFNLPVFNLNDVFITASLLIIFLLGIYDSTHSKERGRESED